MATYNLTEGRRYKATLTLGWLESFAGNDMVADQLAKAGFADIQVTGEGESRLAEGTWTRASQEVKLPEQVTEMVEVA